MDQEQVQKCLAALQTELKNLSDVDDLSKSQNQTLVTNLRYLQPPPNDSSGAKKTRHKNAHAILTRIKRNLPLEAFFLCCIALRPTWLGQTAKVDFLDPLRDWWEIAKASVSKSYHDLTRVLQSKHLGPPKTGMSRFIHLLKIYH